VPQQITKNNRMGKPGVNRIRVTKAFAVALATINAALTGVYLFRLRQDMSSAYANGAEILWDMTIPWIHLRIMAALILAAVCLFIRNRGGMVCSLLSFIWVIGEYVRWFFILRQVRETIGIHQTGFLFGFEWWNVGIFVLTSMLVVMVAQTIMVGGYPKPRGKISENTTIRDG
jgi:hypothetical protein